MTPITISAVTLSQSIIYGAKNDQIVSVPCVELKLSDGSVYKGDGVFDGSSLMNTNHRQAIIESIEKSLVGQEARDFFHLAELIDQITYEAEEWRYPEPIEETGEDRLKKNRRDILSGLGVIEQKQPEKVLLPVSRALPKAIVRGATAALLRSAAHVNQATLLQFIQSICGAAVEPSRPAYKLKLGVDVTLASQQPLLKHASALCYSVPSASGAESLGKSNEKFQKYLRELNSWANEIWSKQEPADRPWLFVDLNGTIHRLNGNVTGKTLGSLFGFSTTGNQGRMIFANAIENITPLKTVNDTTLLKSLVQSRKLKLKLAAGSDTHTLENVVLWLEKCKPELIVLKEIETANLGEWLKIIQLVREHQTKIILVGSKLGNPRSWELLHAIATAAEPEFYIPAGGKHGFVNLLSR